MKRYPYLLEFLADDFTGGFDENGNYRPGASYWTELGPCRDEPNSSGRAITAGDGSVVIHDAVIYTPKGTPALPVGAKIRVKSAAGIRFEGRVLRASADRLNTRIWA